MPSYISHAIMGSEVCKKANENEKLFYIPIKENELRSYTLGADFALMSRKISKNPHNNYTQLFFLNMISYIKENNLMENSSIMAMLYAHIAHYFFDVFTHPLIYYIEENCQYQSILPNHILIEGYLSSYLSKKILNKDIMDVKPDYFTEANFSDKEIINLLNSVYGKVYNDYNMINTYKHIMMIIKSMETIIKSSFVSKSTLIFFSNFNVFLANNKLSINDLTNENRETYINLITGEKDNESFIELYHKSIIMTLDAIHEVNCYLYGKMPISDLTKVFKDLSYDTGAPCRLGSKKNYTRVKIKDSKSFLQ